MLHYIGLMPLEDLISTVRGLRAEGIKRFNIKMGKDPLSDVVRLTAVREALGEECAIIGDANKGMTRLLSPTVWYSTGPDICWLWVHAW